MKKWISGIGLVVWSMTVGGAAAPVQTHAVAIPNPILFVGQVPIPGDFTSVASTFGNHNGDEAVAPRGGDLFILYPSGTLKNVTRTAGFGNSGFQGASSIAEKKRPI